MNKLGIHGAHEAKCVRGIYFILAAVLLAAAIALTLPLTAQGIACAQDDTFSVVFPTVSYFQSDDPTLISANDSYLIIYDETASALFVRMNGRAGTYAYPLDLEDVQYVKAVGNTAFIYADARCYTVDISDPAATPTERTLTTPTDANYFRSDGKYLYAKSSFGFISVYDENLDIALGIDNHVYIDDKYVSVFAGMHPLAGEDGLLYYFPFMSGDPYYIVYDPATRSELVRESINCIIAEAYVGDIIFAKVRPGASASDEESPLVGLDKETGEVLFSSDLIPDSFCASSDRLYTVEGKQIVTYTLDRTSDGKYVGFKKVSTISMAGSDSFHLNEPCDIIRFDGKLVVADKLNKRLGFINSASLMTTLPLDSAPLRLTSDGTGVYALCEDGRIYKCENGQITKSYDTDGVLDICYFDKLYLVKDDGLYTALAGGVYKIAAIDGARRVSCAKDGTNVYVLTDGGIYVIAKDGTPLYVMDGELEDVIDFGIDYAGDVTVLYAGGLETYANVAGKLSSVHSVEFYSSSAHAVANSMCLDTGAVYFTADECLVGKTFVSTATKDSYASSQIYTPNGDEAYSFAKLKENTPSFIIPTDGRMENVSSAPTETVIVLNEVDTGIEGYSYALLRGNAFLIATDDFDEVETAALSGDYFAVSDTSFYTLPDINRGKIAVLEGTRFTLSSDCADYDGGVWVRVSYDEKVYFAKAEDCEEYVYVIPEEEKTYGKAKAKRVGGLVNIYEQADDSSAAIKEIVDGTTVEILEELDGFYLVRHGEDIGYMLKAEVKIGGLTTVQIVSIVLAVLVVIAGACIFAAIRLTKKKADDVARKKESK